MILILPSFFELPKFFALARSSCLIDCRYFGEYKRGIFDFYSPKSKKLLYLRGKKDWNWDVQKSDFSGRFFGSYSFFPNVREETKKYLELKYKDLHDDSFEEPKISKYMIEKELRIKLFQQIYENLENITINQLSRAFGVSERTGVRWNSLHLIEEKDKVPFNNISLTKEKGNLRDDLAGEQ